MATTDERTVSGRVIIQVSDGDQFRIRVVRTESADNLETVADGSSLTGRLFRT